MQFGCNKEGFNAISTLEQSSRARIGILGNNELHECDSCDSRIGFGTEGNPNNDNTCGNVGHNSGDNGEKDIRTMGYILVQ